MITHAKPAYDLCAYVAFDECGSPQHLFFVAMVAMQHTYSSCSRMSIDAGEEDSLRICIAPEAAACLLPGRAIAVVAHAKFTNDLCASFAMHELDGPLRCISSVPLRCHAASKAVHALNCIAPLRCHAASRSLKQKFEQKFLIHVTCFCYNHQTTATATVAAIMPRHSNASSRRLCRSFAAYCSRCHCRASSPCLTLTPGRTTRPGITARG